MLEELVFHWLFTILWVIFLTIRGYYGRKAQPTGQKRTRQERWQESTKYERPIFVITRLILMLTLLIFIAGYALTPILFLWAQLPIHPWIRWVGVGLGILMMAFIIWVGQTLGKHVSGQLELRTNHTLITTGPYSRVRHPMYTIYLIFNIAMLLVSANWLLILITLIGLILLYWRIKAEEQMLLDQFGDEYRVYMQNTGRFLPPFRRRKTSSEG